MSRRHSNVIGAKSPEQLELEALIQNAKESLAAAEKLCDEKGLTFSFYVVGDLGAKYYGKTAYAQVMDDFDAEDEEAAKKLIAKGNGDSFYDGWYSSYWSR